MCWAIVFFTVLDVTNADALMSKRTKQRHAEKEEKQQNENDKPVDGGVLAVASLPVADNEKPEKARLDEGEEDNELKKNMFEKTWNANSSWIGSAVEDAVEFAKQNEPRSSQALDKFHLSPGDGTSNRAVFDIGVSFNESVWPSLKGRGWKAEEVDNGALAVKTRYSFEGKNVSSSFHDRCRRRPFALSKMLLFFCRKVLVTRSSPRRCQRYSPRACERG